MDLKIHEMEDEIKRIKDAMAERCYTVGELAEVCPCDDHTCPIHPHYEAPKAPPPAQDAA